MLWNHQSCAAFFQSYNENLDSLVVMWWVVGSFKPGVVDTYFHVCKGPFGMRLNRISHARGGGNFKSMKENAGTAVNNTEVILKARPPPKGALDTPENAL
jgi:hypothetical protein